MNDVNYKKMLGCAACAAVGVSFAGIAVIFFLLITGAANIKGFGGDPAVSQIYVKWTSVALNCILAATGVSCAFSAASKNKIFKITSAALNFTVTVCAIVFARIIKQYAPTLSEFNAVSGFISEYYILAALAAVLTVFYTVFACLAFKKPEEIQPEVGGGE